MFLTGLRVADGQHSCQSKRKILKTGKIFHLCNNSNQINRNKIKKIYVYLCTLNLNPLKASMSISYPKNSWIHKVFLSYTAVTLKNE